jgi:hypothetical protein
MNRGRHRKKQHLVVQVLGTAVSNRMMECQLRQGQKPNLDVFLREPSAGSLEGGFVWAKTTEGWGYWHDRVDELRNHPLYKQYKNDWR